jgi:hypothetical protein
MASPMKGDRRERFREEEPAPVPPKKTRKVAKKTTAKKS